MRTSNSLRVAIASSEPFGKRGSIGVSVRISELARGLTRRGFNIRVFNPYRTDPFMSAEETMMSHDVHDFPALSKEILFSVAHKSLNSKLGRSFLLNQFTVKAMTRSFSNRLATALRETPCSLLQGEQEVAALACIEAKNQIDVPVITDFHGIWIQEMGLDKGNSRLRTNFMRFLSEIIDKSEVILVVCKHNKNYLVNNLCVKPSKVEILPNAAPFPTKINVQRKWTIPRVVFSGSLEPCENVELYIRSVPYIKRKFPKAEFYIIGHGRSKSYLEKLCTKIGSPVTFVPSLRHDELIDKLNGFNIGVIPTRAEGAMPLKLFEYMSVGLPLVVSEGTECAEFVARGRYGIVAKPDPASFGDAVSFFLGNPSFADSLSTRCIEAIRKKYNWDVVCHRLAEIYKSVLSRWS